MDVDIRTDDNIISVVAFTLLNSNFKQRAHFQQKWGGPTPADIKTHILVLTET